MAYDTSAPQNTPYNVAGQNVATDYCGKPQELSEEEKGKYRFQLQRMIRAMNARDQAQDEFDGMTFAENFTFNRKLANSFIPPRKNATDVSVVTGTARAKMKALAANLLKLNLDPNILAFDNNQDEDVNLGHLLADLVRKSNELDGDDEKKVLRLYSLFEQGTVFIGEQWSAFTKMEKKMDKSAKFDPRTGMKVKNWTENAVTDYRCERTMYSMVEVYLGNIKQYEMQKQPFIYTRQVMDYDEARTYFGQWSEWKYVKKGGKRLVDDGTDSLPYNNFRLYDLDQNQVEVIRYEDYANNEVQIYINGTAMLPYGFPFWWSWEGYSVSKHVLDPISSDFAYGKSLMAEIRLQVEVLDEMLRMMLHKTKQSIKPPVSNMTGKALSPRIFDPGVMTIGVDASMIKRLVEHQGVTAPEFNMYQLLKNTIDSQTVSQVFMGQKTQGTTTATEILEMQRQAQNALTLILLSVQLMEERIAWMRLHNILENWTKPIDSTVDDVSKKLVKKYRTVSVDNSSFDGKMGRHKIEMVDYVPTQKERSEYSYKKLTEEMRTKSPIKNSRLILPVLQQLKYTFFVKVNPSDRPSDNLNKVLFREMMDQAMAYFGQSVNMDFLKKRWASTWQINAEDVFSQLSINGMESVVDMQGKIGRQMKGLVSQEEQASSGKKPAPKPSASAAMNGLTPGQQMPTEAMEMMNK